ncbi:MAG: NifU family protein [Patescibacteria group bacterium]
MNEQNTVTSLRDRIESALDEVRGGIKLHNGGVDIIDIDEQNGVLTVRMTGMCVGCAFAGETLKECIEEVVTSMVPEIREVVAG